MPNEIKPEISVICPCCGVIKFDKLDIENIEEFGKCLVCEKIEGECREQLED